jgi:hypothetical protein
MGIGITFVMFRNGRLDTMFIDNGSDIFARADTLGDIPREILSQFPNCTIVTRPEDCI